jgi:uncharacterized membrane protein
MNALVKRFKSKTYWLAVVGAILTAVEVQGGFFSQYVAEAYRPLLVMFWPVLMLMAREVTTTALSEK